MKKFIITIDTEGDNLWAWKPGDKITTNNAQYLQRFQDLCNDYGFKPVWLTNYEMISDDKYVDFISRVEEQKLGELGMHLHAWNNPPVYELPKVQDGAPYLIEYPKDIMEAKISYLTNLIKSKTGITPVSHRAGRWAMNQGYFDLLIKYGYKVDCSITPHIDWSACFGQTDGSKGSDYSQYGDLPEKIYDSTKKDFLLEVPVTVKYSHKFFKPDEISLRNLGGAFYRTFCGQNVWLRPNGRNFAQMDWLVRNIAKTENDYLMFMLHSSELMPGGSITFKSSESIEKLYINLKKLFKNISCVYEGITLRDYYLSKGI
jgi:hypothetical protein